MTRSVLPVDHCSYNRVLTKDSCRVYDWEIQGHETCRLAMIFLKCPQHYLVMDRWGLVVPNQFSSVVFGTALWGSKKCHPWRYKLSLGSWENRSQHLSLLCWSQNNPKRHFDFVLPAIAVHWGMVWRCYFDSCFVTTEWGRYHFQIVGCPYHQTVAGFVVNIETAKEPWEIDRCLFDSTDMLSHREPMWIECELACISDDIVVWHCPERSSLELVCILFLSKDVSKTSEEDKDAWSLDVK